MEIQIIMLLAFFAVTIFVGFYFRKRAGSVNDFVLGGREVGPWLTAFAYGTSYFSAVVFVGYAGQFGWLFGTSATWIGLGNAFVGCLLPWVILGRRTRIMTNHLKSATMPEFFGARYSSRALKIAASIIIFIFLIPYTASLYNGLSRLFAMAFNVPFTYCIIAMGVLTAIFVVAGGYVASAVNNFIQGIIMLAGIVAVIAVALSQKGGFLNALNEMASVPAGTGFRESVPGVFASFFGPNPINLLGVIILTSLGTWGLPQMVGRFYSIKNENMIKKGAIVSTIFALFIAGGSYFLGSFGRIFVTQEFVDQNKYDAIIPEILSSMGPVMIGLVIVLVFAASISTLASLVMASASTLTLDFLKGNFIKKMTDKSQLIIIRVLIVVFIAVSSIIAIIQYTGGISLIAQLMGVSWGALAGAFLAPFLYGLYWKRVSKLSVWCCFLFSTGLMILNIIFRETFPEIIKSPINAGAFAMLAGLVIVPVVSLISKAPQKDTVDNAFSCYEQTVSVKVRDDLG